MKILKLFLKLGGLFLIVGAISSLLLSYNKEDYISFNDDNLNLY